MRALTTLPDNVIFEFVARTQRSLIYLSIILLSTLHYYGIGYIGLS